MPVEYGALGFVREGEIGLTQPSDVEYGFLFAFDYYKKGRGVKYFAKLKDSMEVQLVELVHASTKKMRDVKWSYAKRI
jgi:hypothetical protein